MLTDDVCSLPIVATTADTIETLPMLPEEVYVSLFRQVHQREYTALACCSHSFETMAYTLRSILTLESDAVTCFVEGIHLTVYQTAMLRRLLRYGKESYYTYVPDVFNLFTIGIVYSFLCKENLIVSDAAFESVTQFIESEPTLAALAQSETFPQIRPNDTLDKSWIWVGEVSLCVGIPQSRSYAVHPAFEQEQRYPVWCFNAGKSRFKRLDSLRMLQLSEYSEHALYGAKTICSRGQPYTKQDFRTNDVFYIENISPYNVFSILSQIPSKRAKLCFAHGDYPRTAPYTPMPLPVAHYRAFPGKLQQSPKLPPYIIPKDMTYAKLMEIQNSVHVLRTKISSREAEREWVLIDSRCAPTDMLVTAPVPHPLPTPKEILAEMDEEDLTTSNMAWLQRLCRIHNIYSEGEFNPSEALIRLRVIFED